MAGLFSGGTGGYKAAIAQSQANTQAAIEQANARAAELQQSFMASQRDFADRAMQSDQRYIDAINAATSEGERQRLAEEAARAADESRRIADENRLADLAAGNVAQIDTGGGDRQATVAAEDDLLKPRRRRTTAGLSNILGINI